MWNWLGGAGIERRVGVGRQEDSIGRAVGYLCFPDTAVDGHFQLNRAWTGSLNVVAQVEWGFQILEIGND